MSPTHELLLDAKTSALTLLVACRQMFGDVCVAWEPESLWLTALQKGIDVPVLNRSKIQAGIALIYVPSFYWDAVVFEKTALAFSDVSVNPDALQEATPAQLAWATVEAKRMVDRFNPEAHEFDTEPKVYAATVLHRAGFALAPTELSFAQGQLDRINQGGAELRTRVAERLAQLGSPDAANHSFEETPDGVQLGYLTVVKLYVDEKRKQLDAELARFN